MREIRLEIVPRPEGGVAIIYEKSEQLGEGPYVAGEGEERDENRRLLCGNYGHMLANNLGNTGDGCNSYNKSSG